MNIGRFITLCWLAFLIYWLVSSVSGKKIAERQSIMEGFWHRFLLVLAIGFIWIFTFDFPIYPLTQEIFPWPLGLGILGCIICFLGLCGAVWARRTLGGNWSGTITFKHGHELIQKGPYQFVRHPIYTAILMMFLGTALAENNLGGYLAIVTIFFAFLIKSQQEEKLMLKHFQKQYEDYMRRVKALIPFIF